MSFQFVFSFSVPLVLSLVSYLLFGVSTLLEVLQYIQIKTGCALKLLHSEDTWKTEIQMLRFWYLDSLVGVQIDLNDFASTLYTVLFLCWKEVPVDQNLCFGYAAQSNCPEEYVMISAVKQVALFFLCLYQIQFGASLCQRPLASLGMVESCLCSGKQGLVYQIRKLVISRALFPNGGKRLKLQERMSYSCVAHGEQCYMQESKECDLKVAEI